MARLPNIPPGDLTVDQRPLFDKIQDGVKRHLTGFTTQKADGAMIGPFTGMLTFPEFGTPIFDMFLALAGGTVLSVEAREVVILATGGRFGAMYEIYSHEALAAKAGLSQSKIRSLAAGEKPNDLSEVETIAYDITACLHRGHQIPTSLYESAVSSFGPKGVAEIAYLYGCYTTICSLCNAFDVDLTGTEEG